MKLVTLDGKMNQDEIIVDNFAGGGGASTGIELAIGRSVDVAINHDPDAIAMGFPGNYIIDRDQFGKKFQKINKLLDVEMR